MRKPRANPWEGLRCETCSEPLPEDGGWDASGRWCDGICHGAAYDDVADLAHDIWSDRKAGF